MIIVTAQSKCDPAKQKQSVTGFGNHTLSNAPMHYVAELIIAEKAASKAIYQSKQEIMDEVLIPAFTAAGSSVPKDAADRAYRALALEQKIIDTDQLTSS